MRQFITWQFWLSLLALGALFGGLLLFTDDDEQATLIAASASGQLLTKAEQPIDLILLVYAAQADPGFAFVDGKSTARVMIVIDGFRYMDVPAGTPGENRCAELALLARCVVAANVLGDAVLWFSLLPIEPRNLITLPPISQLRDGGNVQLANGWVVARAPVIVRESEACGTDTTSLADFLERYADTSTSTYSMEEQRITAVTCLAT